MASKAIGSTERSKSDPQVYCIVPARLAAIQPRLCEHFADDESVEVVLDKRVGERRGGGGPDILDELSKRLVPGMERRTIGGRRTAVPVTRPVQLPDELRAYEAELTFLAAPRFSAAAHPDDEWERRAVAAEAQALDLARALIDATDALRARGGLSPSRFRELARAEAAVERYYAWRLRWERPPP